MPMLGAGAMIFWHDVADGTDRDFQDWHSHEHLAERVGIPGFRRGRRYAAADGSPGYCIFYEVAAFDVLTSQAYLDRLNDPTPWTTRALGYFRRSNRTLCRVTASHGLGIGTWLATVRLSPQAGREDALDAWLGAECLPELAGRSGLCGGHLLKGDQEASRTETAEKKLRDRPDDVADWVVLVEGYDEAAIEAVRTGELAPDRLVERGAAPGADARVYRYVHSLSAADLGKTD